MQTLISQVSLDNVFIVSSSSELSLRIIKVDNFGKNCDMQHNWCTEALFFIES